MKLKIFITAIIILAIAAIIIINQTTKDSEQNLSEQESIIPNDHEGSGLSASTDDSTPKNQQNQNTNESDKSTSSDQTTITGTFSMYAIGLAPETLCITPDGAENLLCFDDQTKAQSALNTDQAGNLGQPGCDEIRGRAIITYQNYQPGYYNTGGGSISLVKVDRILEPARCENIN